MRFYGLDQLDARIAEHLTAVRGSFVELGAFDGVTQSNTLHFEEKGWRGVLIEPLPDAYARCVVNRPLAKVYHCACVPPDFPLPAVRLTSVGLMSMLKGTMNDDAREEAWIARGEMVQNLRRQEIEVPARTLDSILRDARIPHPDLLILDVEGAELSVLKGLDLTRHRPANIVCEDAYDHAVADHLTARGYERRAVLLERRFTREVLYCDRQRRA